MAKKDDIILIIAKALSEQDFTKEEKVLCCDLTISNLVSEHGLNDIQSRHVLNWCAIQQSKLSNKMKKEVLEEGLFSFLDRRKKKKTEKIFKEILNNEKVELTVFLKDVAHLVKAIKKEKGIADYRTDKKDHPPEADWNVQRIQKISRILFTLKKEFERFGVKSAKRVTESLEMKDLNQKAASMSINLELRKIQNSRYYDQDMTTIVRPFLNLIKRHFKLSSKQIQQISGRFSLFIKNLLDDLNEELNNYKNAVEHGKLTLARDYTPPKRYYSN